MVLWDRVDTPLPRIVASLPLAGMENEVDNLDSKEVSAIGGRGEGLEELLSGRK